MCSLGNSTAKSFHHAAAYHATVHKLHPSWSRASSAYLGDHANQELILLDLVLRQRAFIL